ncbi:hypothetical protein LKO27_09590 [Tessaracoccus sp. OS52]|uniref:hypothetical protein n=1 Tax=Tessaracoccus sp. OS52 TaxID=2886691 RepID=UPI001D10682D|nr:hypothetical protein [Tessaracoccus sp. OS52]MCC2593655.1 hypothetical protein [Tessaracoccus sp. OS52]
MRDLYEPSFPASVGGFVQEGEIRTDFDGGNASYVSADYRGFNADINYGHATYDMLVEGLLDAAYYGDAVCGVEESYPTLGSCVMAGQAEVLYTGAGVEDVPLEELAALTQELYGKL